MAFRFSIKKCGPFIETTFRVLNVPTIVFKQFPSYQAVDEFKNNFKEEEIHPAKLSRKRMDLLECHDANDYSPLSEAGAGGASEVRKIYSTLIRIIHTIL